MSRKLKLEWTWTVNLSFISCKVDKPFRCVFIGIKLNIPFYSDLENSHNDKYGQSLILSKRALLYYYLENILWKIIIFCRLQIIFYLSRIRIFQDISSLIFLFTAAMIMLKYSWISLLRASESQRSDEQSMNLLEGYLAVSNTLECQLMRRQLMRLFVKILGTPYANLWDILKNLKSLISWPIF